MDDDLESFIIVAVMRQIDRSMARWINNSIFPRTHSSCEPSCGSIPMTSSPKRSFSLLCTGILQLLLQVKVQLTRVAPGYKSPHAPMAQKEKRKSTAASASKKKLLRTYVHGVCMCTKAALCVRTYVRTRACIYVNRHDRWRFWRCRDGKFGCAPSWKEAKGVCIFHRLFCNAPITCQVVVD